MIMPQNNYNRGQGYNQSRPGGQREREQVTDPIPSPYNFVPLSDQVFFPEWWEQASMDVPFSDGISGTLKLKVTAKTPIYIRNGGAHPEGKARLEDKDYIDFFRVHPGGPYAIPGTSLKGMLRAVLEIASFGKIVGSKSAPRVSDHRYAVRDLHDSKLYTTQITQGDRNSGYEPKVNAAWLSEAQSGGGWQIELCDFARAEQEELEAYSKKSINLGLGNTGREKTTSKHKYQIWADTGKSKSIRFDIDPTTVHDHSCGKLKYKKAINFGSGAHEGTLVFTGQPSDRKPRGLKKFNPRTQQEQRVSRGKHMEFVFYGEPRPPMPVSESVCKDFEFAHSELGENRKPNKEWGYWKERFEHGEKIPVFVLIKDSALHSMGLAMMYRFPYENSIHQTIAHTSEAHFETAQMDLAETLFGRVEDQDGLRGRVAVETCLVDGEQQAMGRDLTVLGAPKPTFCPNYIKQNANRDGTVNEYKTYMDKTAEIRGWKRYIVGLDGEHRPLDKPPSRDNGEVNLDVATKFSPLPAGTTFSGSLHLHNVRPQELGALIWAIQWGGNGNLRHSLGMGKPYGLGSVTVRIEDDAGLRWCNPDKQEPIDASIAVKSFVELMGTRIPGWETSPQILALKTMANPLSDWPQEVRNPTLAPNEFVAHKKAKHCLIDPSTAVSRKPVSPPKIVAKAEAVERTPAELFLNEIDRLGIGQIPKRIKGLKLDPAQVPVDLRKKIFDKLKKRPGATNWNFKDILDQWMT